jgi:hypothetical protein
LWLLNSQQAATKDKRDIRKQQRDEAAAVSKGLVDFHRHNPPKYKGEHDSYMADLWLQKIERKDL